MKTCSRCKEEKPFDLFGSNKSTGDGLTCYCVPCKNKIQQEWRAVNPEKSILHNKARHAKKMEWQKAHPAITNAKAARRRAAQLQRTPSGACFDSIKEFYTCAKDLEELTGIEFHVDHIIPLQGKLVSGLHVASNLQILTATENISKSNTFQVG